MKALLVAGVIACAVFGAAFGVLEGVLASPSQAERLGLRAQKEIGSGSFRGAMLHVGDRTIAVSCRRVSAGTVAVRPAGGSELLVSGAHVRARPPATLTPAAVGQAVLGGVRSLYARLLTVRLANRDVELRPLVFAGRPAYAIRLTSGRPATELLVDRGTLAPVGALYRSRAISGSSRFLPADVANGC